MREIPGGGEPNQKPLKKDDFVVPAQQTERTEVFTAQHSGQEPERQTKENLPVALRRTGSRPTPPESTPSGELYRGSLIRSLREEKGLSMQEVESQLGYARRSLSMIERNRFVPTQEKLEQLAEVLDVPVEALAQAPAHPRVKKGVPPGKAPQPPEFTETGEMYLGSLIRKLRLERGLDAADAAAQLGYAPTTLRRIETNNSFLSGGKLQQFAEVLEVPVEELAQAPMHPKAKKHVPRGY
jgi:transcriptional regulator with XRE-family HTH domain